MNFSDKSRSSISLKTVSMIVAFILKHESCVRYDLGVALKEKGWDKVSSSCRCCMKRTSDFANSCSFCDVRTRACALSLLFQPRIMPKTTENRVIFKLLLLNN